MRTPSSAAVAELRALARFAAAAAVLLLSLRASAALEQRAIELAVEEQRIIGTSLPVDEVARWSLEGSEQRIATLRTVRSDAKLFIVHLWATWCKPCMDEFPRLKQMFPDGRLREAQLVLVAVQSPQDDLRTYIRKHIENIPRTQHYLDSNGAMQKALNLSKLPITLLVDQKWVVRQAFSGSIAERRQELMESIERYLYPPLLTAFSGKYLECSSPPCLEPSFFLHRSLLLQQTRRWQPRRRTLLPALVILPVSAQPNLLYLFTPSCTQCMADLAYLQKLVRGWRKAKGAQASFVTLVVAADPSVAFSLLEQQQAVLPDTLVVHSAMPKLVQLMDAAGGPVTLVMNRQGYIRNAFVGPFMSYQKAITDALLQTVHER